MTHDERLQEDRDEWLGLGVDMLAMFIILGLLLFL